MSDLRLHRPLWTVKVWDDDAMADTRDTTVNATAASLLGFLHNGPMSGWDLVATAQVCIGGFWTVTRSQVYRELSGLARAGLVEELETQARDRKPYRITDAGRAEFAAWISVLPEPEVIRHPLLLMISFGEHVPASVLSEAVAAHRSTHEENLRRYREQKDAALDDPYAAATLDFGIAYETMVLSWLDGLPWQ